VQFGEEIAEKGETKSRAVYTVDIECSQDMTELQVVSFNFAPAAELDYN
jgi:hypothetical protein